MDKYGRCKYLSYDDLMNMPEYDNMGMMELFDMILYDEEIPYQSERKMDEYLLEQVINMKPFSLPEMNTSFNGTSFVPIVADFYYAIIGVGENREVLRIDSKVAPNQVKGVCKGQVKYD